MNTIENQYLPDHVSPPGGSLDDILEERRISQAELAERTGLTTKTVNEIIKGKAPISPDTALLLERVLGTPAHFWNNRERRYREFVTQHNEYEQLKGQTHWLARFPMKKMMDLGWILPVKDKVEQMRQLLSFFGVASWDQWEAIWLEEKARAAFRQSLAFTSQPGPVSAWLRYGEVIASQHHHTPYNATRFKDALRSIRCLSCEAPETFVPRMIELCASAGVSFVPTPELPKAHICGATRWLDPERALIQISLRYKRDDHFWFTFFHEAGHVLLHGKREVFLEGSEDVLEQQKEAEANRFASEFLIPPAAMREFIARSVYSHVAVEEFAAQLGIAPGIVVGQLHHGNYLPHSHLNSLRRTLLWKHVSNGA